MNIEFRPNEASSPHTTDVYVDGELRARILPRLIRKVAGVRNPTPPIYRLELWLTKDAKKFSIAGSYQSSKAATEHAVDALRTVAAGESVMSFKPVTWKQALTGTGGR